MFAQRPQPFHETSGAAGLSLPEGLAAPDPLTEPQIDWLLWQVADSAFPTGGFAHSGGLEAAWQNGEIEGSPALQSFIRASLRQVGRGGLPLMVASYQHPGRLIEFDLLCESFVLNHVANRASRSQGRALLVTTQRVFSERLKAAFHDDSVKPPYCHLAPVFGFIARCLEIERCTACRLFLFLHTRSLIASAVRLGIVGPMEAQALQSALAPLAEEVLRHCQELSLEQIAQVSPLLDLWQGIHDRLYSRLFQS